jgi:hypothetical protein
MFGRQTTGDTIQIYWFGASFWPQQGANEKPNFYCWLVLLKRCGVTGVTRLVHLFDLLFHLAV